MKQALKYLALALLVVLSSCRDEFAEIQNLQTDEVRGTEQLNAGDNTGLVLLENGTWKANCRVPLTGVGRTIGNMSPGLVSLLGGQGNLNNILDNNLENKATLAGLTTANVAYTQIISVKDMYRTYSGGQKAGFVYEITDTKLLTVDVLKLFTITLYNNGELKKTFSVSEEGELLGLNLINVSTAGTNAQQVVAVDVPDGMDFDEIAIGYGGVDVSVLGSMNIYYAFVGETPMRTTVKNTSFDSNPYMQASIYGGLSWSNWAGRDEFIDDDPKNGPVIELIGGALNFLGGGYKVTVNFGEPVPAGSEVGFVYRAGNVLNLGIGSTVSLYTYSADPDGGFLEKDEEPIEKYSVGNVLGASAIGGGQGTYSFITTKDFQNLYMHIIGLNVNIGTTQYHYAFTRAKTEVDATSYFNFPEKVTTSTSGYQILKPEKGELTVVPGSHPEGANNFKWLEEQSRLSGMTVDGEYEVTFTYNYDGKIFTQRVIFTKISGQDNEACNRLITSVDNKAQIASVDADWGVCVICGNSQNKEYLLDEYVSTAMTYYGALELISKQNIVTVNNITNLQVDDNGYRAGFIMQVSKELLSLNALNYLYVDLYKNGKKLERTVSGTRPTVDLGLINGDQGKVRIGVTMPGGTEAFDEIRLCNAGVLALNFNTIRLYGVFYEPANLECASNGVSEACMEMVTPANYGASINYDETKYKTLVGVGNGMYSLDNVLDDDKDSYVTIATTNVIGETALAVKFNEMPAGQWIGAMIRNVNGIADVKLLDALTFEVYHNGVLVADYDNNKDLLDVSLISYEDKIYLELQPDQPFDEVRISGKSVANVLDQLMVYGIYTRVDANGDGIPDCGEPEEPVETDKIYPTVSELHTCDGTDLSIPVTGGTKGNIYTLRFKQYDDECCGHQIGENEYTVTYTGNRQLTVKGVLQPGVYLVDFCSEDGETNYYTGLQVYIHPKQTTWKGGAREKMEHTWNLWTNWSDGTPWGCTDVVIPAGLAYYPILTDEDNNNCARIQFKAGADGAVGEVVNTQYLTYDQAWVDYQLTGGKYYLLSAPLKDTYTGDVFGMEAYAQIGSETSTADYSDAWRVFDTQNYPLNDNFRFTPQVYQRTFGGFINNHTGSGTEQLQPGSDNWTSPFNLVAERYEAGSAFLVKMGDDNTQTYALRWPKLYTSYEYYDENTEKMIEGRTEQVDRSKAGRFIHEDSKGETAFPMQVYVENDRPGDTYLVGNPFMAHINIEEFLKANVGIGEIWLLRGKDSYSSSSYTVVKRGDNDNVASQQITPMEGFLVKLRSPYSETNRYKYYVTFTKEMLEQNK